MPPPVDVIAAGMTVLLVLPAERVGVAVEVLQEVGRRAQVREVAAVHPSHAIWIAESCDERDVGMERRRVCLRRACGGFSCGVNVEVRVEV